VLARDPDLPEFDTRPSIRLSNTAPEHPKIVGLSDKAFRLWVETLCYCSRQESDGRVTFAAIRRQGAARVVDELLAAGLLVDEGDGYAVHDYLRHNRAASEIQSFRESKSESGALGAHKRWHVPRRQFSKECHYCLEEARGA
jgi:hypothetical protein